MPSEQETAFPQLTDAQIDLLRPGGRVRDVKAGDVLFAEGDRGFSFYVVLDGAAEIIEHSRGVAHTVTVHEPKEFTGDVDMLTGRVALVTGRVARDGQVLELSAAALRQAVDENPELGEASCTRTSPHRRERLRAFFSRLRARCVVPGVPHALR